MVRKAIFLLIFCFFKVAHAATVECIDQGYLGFMRFNGEITSGDLRIVMKCWDYLNLKIEPKEQKAKFVEAKSSPGTTPKTKGSIFIVLSSAGGSVYEAMEIGRFVRKKEMYVSVPDWAKCYSSCVYIFSAGVVRTPINNIGIHRPYFTKDPKIPYDQAMKKLISDSKAYFSEMNIPEIIVEDMFSINPSEMRILSIAELEKYRFIANDMAHDEESDMRQSELLGLSRSEYMTRKKLMRKYTDECLASSRNPESTETIVKCVVASQDKAGLKVTGN